MKKRLLLISAALIVAAVWLSLHRQHQAAVSQSITMPESNHESGSNGPVGSRIRHDAREKSPTAERSVPADVRLYVQNRTSDPQYDWKQPINFFGKVLDESNQPVEGASVDLTWTDLSASGTSEHHTMSDALGSFSMIGRTGKRLSISVSKTGYYTTTDARLASFEYANPADGLFRPDASNPVTFHLRRKGIGANLITSHYGVKDYLGVSMPIDGTPVKVDLLARKSGGEQGHLMLTQRKPPPEKWKEATEWSFHMEIPDGGFVEQNDEFPFEAPEAGYEKSVDFDFRIDQANWTTMLRKDFYVKFGQPACYARLHLETLIEMSGARLTYAVNPDGSRNLEPE